MVPPGDATAASEAAAAVRDEADLVALVARKRSDPTYRRAFEALLRESHPVYRGRGAAAVVRMRGWLLLALGDGPLADSALPYVLEELESAHDPYLTAAAARVLRRTTPRPELVPALLSALVYVRFRDDVVSLEAYGGYEAGDPAERTTAVAEILETLAWLGGAARPALPRLRAWRREVGAGSRLAARLDALVASLAATSPDVAAGAGNGASCCRGRGAAAATAEPFVRRSALGSSPSADLRLQDQSGATLRFADFFHGRPSVVIFFYTRCDNPAKCPTTLRRLARVQSLLRARGLGSAVRTAAITYDPRFDLPERLARFAATWGFVPDADHRLLRTLDDFEPLRAAFGLEVGYVGPGVNRHRIETFVLDSQGRVDLAAVRLRRDAEALVAHAEALLRAGPVSDRQPAALPSRSPPPPPPRRSPRRAARRGGRRTR